ncbi:IS1595 family transposase [Neisseria sp. ZJ106]|uniref:IS1595 family transposase n=1 Tax=Neisseria lisongii TaxID=2912188 RepID=A0ABY7RKY8_9NEIS|nr:IS1595 family transposase [Neisseria lisongii]MCF7521392.1 IS1595 family transposase [Neisseria lisongii]WCL71917.1 IS1595 family transposase [Neisseria lisongii]
MAVVTRDVDVLIQLFRRLPPVERNIFLRLVVAGDDPNRVSEFSQGVARCPHCCKKDYVKNGKKDGRQRFLCRICGRTFGERAETVFYRSKKGLEVWYEYIRCMLNKLPLQRCAEECGICLHTAFSWRHRILGVLQAMMDKVMLNGVVQADETFFRLSFKGQKKLKGEFLGRVGVRQRRRGLSRDQVCVPCAVNLDGLSVGRVSNLGKPSGNDVLGVLDGRIAERSILVTDSNSVYQKVADVMGLSHIPVPSGMRCAAPRAERSPQAAHIFDVQTINSYHSMLKKLVNCRFHGVSTKYLNNYVIYHNFVNFAKGNFKSKCGVLFNFILEMPVRGGLRSLVRRV